MDKICTGFLLPVASTPCAPTLSARSPAPASLVTSSGLRVRAAQTLMSVNTRTGVRIKRIIFTFWQRRDSLIAGLIVEVMLSVLTKMAGVHKMNIIANVWMAYLNHGRQTWVKKLFFIL